MTTPDSSDQVRCGMCGKQNPADRAVCEHCGARLRPMTPEELGLSSDFGLAAPQTPSPSSADRPPRPEQEEPSISWPRTTQPADEEPDFMIGSPPESAGLPEEPSSEIPDWLAGESDTSAPRTGPTDIPDWLGESSPAGSQIPPSFGESQMPDWLRAPEDEQPQEPPTEIPDWLAESGRSDVTRPIQPAEETPAAAYGDMPDWLRPSEDEQPQEPPTEIPDWLAETGRSQATRPVQPSEETPDWLRKTPQAMETQPAEEAPDWLRAPEDEQPQEPPTEIPDWLSETTPPAAHPIRPAEEAPDWLRETPEEMDDQPVASEEEVPDWLRAPDEAEEPSEGSVKPLLDTGMPDWLQTGALESHEAPAAAEPEAQLPDWLRAPDEPVTEVPAEPSAIEPPTPEPPQPEMPPVRRSGVTDWLRGLGVEPTAEEIQSAMEEHAAASQAADELEAMHPGPEPAVQPETPVERPPVAEETPDWLLNMLGEQPPEEPGPSAVETPMAGTESDLPEALERQAEDTGPEPLAETGIPEWLSDISSEGEAPVGEVEPPDWLRPPSEEGAQEPAQPEAEVVGQEDISVPDWLREAGSETPALSEETAAEQPAVDVPDWLSAIPAQPPTSPRTHIDEPIPAPTDVPEWLDKVTAAPAGETEESEEPAGAAEAEPVEVPDWLSGLAEETPAASTAPPSAEAEVEVPDWLAGIGEGESAAPAAPVSQPEPLTAPESVEVPNWLSGIAGTAEPVQPAAEPPAHEEAAELPDWLAGTGSELPSSIPVGEQATAPDWLSDLGPIPAGGPAPEAGESEDLLGFESALPAGDADLPDWMRGVDFGEELGMHSAEMPVAPVGEDLLGLSEDLMAPAAAEEEEAVGLTDAELPEWLREAAPGERTGRRTGSLSAELPPGIASEMADLRFDAITGPGALDSDATTETVGALKDVTGVIRPEILFDGASLQVGQLVDEIIITNDQARRIASIQALLEREARGVVVTGERRSVVPLVRWLVVLVLFAAISASAVLGVQILPAPSSNPQADAAHTLIENLPPDSTVVVAFEYEADTAAEMQPLAEALLRHLSGRGAVVYSLSTRPTGPAMAQAALASLDQVPDGWANLGYISGGANGISGLTDGMPGTTSPLQVDYQGQPVNSEAATLRALAPQLLIVVSARPEHLRAWVEQAGAQLDVPMIAAVSAASAPLAYPYQRSGQVGGVLAGISDAVAYNSMESNAGTPGLIALWNSQAVGSAVAAGLIVIGSVVYGLRALRQQE